MSERLVDPYDLVIFDLDGVIYLIDRPIAGAVEAVGELHRAGVPLAYATNNASRRAAEVADLLTGLGVPADAGEVVTSAGASAAVLAQRLPVGAKVLVVGAEALRAEVRDAGLEPVSRAEERPLAVVQGYGPQVGWADLAEAAVAIRGGAQWVATNTDRTLPSPRGPLPGNGSLVAALRTALGREPDLVVGKPEPGLFTTAARKVGASRPLVVGDRLDTDIEGAVRAGMDSLLVLTGVSGPADLLAAPPERRPTYVAADLAGLFEPAGAATVPPAGLFERVGAATVPPAGPEGGRRPAGAATVPPARSEGGRRPAGAATVPPAGSEGGRRPAGAATMPPDGLEHGQRPAGAGTVPPDEVEGWRLEDGTRLAGEGTAVDALRLLCGLAWSGGDAGRVTAGTNAARDALHALGLA